MQQWPVRLFNKSVLKQRKFREITAMLGPTAGLRCLDIGSDNGVISLLLRQQGGSWASADLEEKTVRSIRALVQTDVHRIDGRGTPFADDEFDCVVIVDFLEHIPDDEAFIRELFRILKPDGLLVVNVPHVKHSLLRRFRFAIGQTDEKHGHLRPGYTIESLRRLLGDRFTLEQHHTYSRFFSEWIDTMIVWAVGLLKGRKGDESKKGLVITGEDMAAYQKMFRLYALVYPVVWLIAKLDLLLPFTSGYMLIARARSAKVPVLTRPTVPAEVNHHG
ncbi:MAG: class I SAM-dependent methyltransferase [Chloroflexi bacterium]|nr:class I SAM-dependent methyltransferase [Chloroflexota bacterium]